MIMLNQSIGAIQNRDTDSFIMHIKSKDGYEDIANNVEKRFDTSNYGIKRPLPTGKHENVIRLIKNELDHDKICWT